MKIAIVGSRNLGTEEDYQTLKEFIANTGLRIDIVISGGAEGVDSLAERWAEEHGKELKLYLPNYSRYGRGAPLVRNKEIIENCDAVIAYKNETSKGTDYTLKEAKKQGKKTYIKIANTGGLF